jgi:hypothetical protein
MAKNKTPLGLTYDNLVVGSSLEAILFAFHSKIPFLYTRNLQPYDFEEIIDFGMGTAKLDIWKKLILQMSLAGNNPFENKIKSLRYLDSNTIKVVTEDDHVYPIKFNKLWVFDDFNFEDLPAYIGIIKGKRLVIDYLKIKSPWKHERDVIKTEGDIFQKVIFFAPPGFEDYENRRKYLMAVSLFDGEPFPEYTCRIKLSKFLEEKYGITDLDVEHECREVVDYSRNLYDDFDNVYFVYTDAVHIQTFHNPRYRMDFMKYLRVMMDIK